MGNLQIDRMLVLSTAHISSETNEQLQNNQEEQFPLVVYEKGDYGYLILVPEHDEDLHGVPDDLKRVLEFAALHECEWVMLDCDANVITELPTFEW